VHIHPDIDVMHHVASACHFQFVPAPVAVHAAKNDLAFSERLGIVLPSAGKPPHARLRLQAIDHHLCNLQLRSSGGNIHRLGAHQPVQIRFLNNIAVINNKALKPDVSELELVGLRVEDLKLEHGVIEVRRAVWNGIEGDTKTKSGKRNVFIDSVTIRVLRCFLASRKQEGSSSHGLEHR
jgi:hypothetical protein